MKIIYNDGHVGECPAEEELEVLRHSAAHIMAQAVKRLYPDAHFAYGPATEKGFHYDIDLGDVKLTDVESGREIEPLYRERGESVFVMRARVGKWQAYRIARSE